MIFSNLFTSLAQIIFKPYFLIPMIIIMLLSGLSVELGGWSMERPLIDFVLYPDSIPSDNFIGFLFANYPLELVTMFLLSLIMTVVSVIGMMSVSRLVNKSKFVDAINDSVADWKKALALTIVLLTASLVLGVAFSLILALGVLNTTIQMILFAVFMIIVFVIFVKIIFVIPALIKYDVKKAFQESWKFSDKRFWGTCALIILAFFIGVIGLILIGQLGVLIGSVLGGVFETIFDFLAESFATTYFIAAITNYFYSKQK